VQAADVRAWKDAGQRLFDALLDAHAVFLRLPPGVMRAVEAMSA